MRSFRPDLCLQTIIGLPALLCLFLNCDPNPTPEPAGFSNLTPLTGKRFVAYVSPDRKSKPDTVIVSWNFTGMPLQSIKAEATIDSGVSWILLQNVVQEGDGQALVRWIPGDDTVNFSYFGEKKCILRISAASSDAVVESDSFTILGPQPCILLFPRGGEAFSLNDTVPITYQSNNDRISNIQVFFIHDEMEVWKEIIGSTRRTDEVDPPLRSFITQFIPLVWDTIITNHPGRPVRFLLKDYNSPLPNSSIISSDITLQP